MSVAAAYLQLNKSGSSNLSGAVSQGDGTAAIAADLQRTYGAGINYTYGPATVGFVFTQTMLDDASFITPAGTQVQLPGMRPNALALSPDGRLLVTGTLALSE